MANPELWCAEHAVGPKASKMFDSQPLGIVICSNYIDHNLILFVFKRDVLINFGPSLHGPIVVTLHSCGYVYNECFHGPIGNVLFNTK